MTEVKKRSVDIGGHRTSISIESEFWDALAAIAATKKTSVAALIAAIDSARKGNLSSAIRVYVLKEVQKG